MYLYNVNKTRTMNEKEEISAILHRLTQLKMELKMTEFTFKNNKKLTEQQVNSILDEKLRIEKFIRILEFQIASHVFQFIIDLFVSV